PAAPLPATYAASPQRQLFEAIRDSLHAMNRADQWSDVIRALDLYGAGTLQKSETLTLLETVLKSRPELFARLKALLGADGEPGATPGPWYSTPLAAIDFRNCPNCTPSYKQLPDFYARPACGGRSVAEERLLNDAWVSVPKGSEGSDDTAAFKFLRKNQYEDALFRCEDERFEMDMVLDATAAAIRRLEPLAKEISALQSLAPPPVVDSGGMAGSENDDESSESAASGAGANSGGVGGGSGARRFEYRVDPRALGAVHWNAISRIYGEHGPDVVEALKRNPAGAVPTVLRRLKQKEKEWRLVRTELNKGWKETVERNFHKALDKQTVVFRLHDPKTYSPSVLLAAVRDRKGAED
ncbi:unnamed protein product, partial [Phaeothamnion confervicola]